MTRLCDLPYADALQHIAFEQIAEAKKSRDHYNGLTKKSARSKREIAMIPTHVKIARDFNHRSIQARRAGN